MGTTTFRVLIGVAFVGVIAIGGHARGQAVVGPIFDPYSDANLYLVAGTWTAAQDEAQGMGGNLVTIHSLAENDFIGTTLFRDFTSVGGPNLTNYYGLWIGLYDPTGTVQDDGPGGPGSQHAANFVWVGGETAAYRNWYSGEPNDRLGHEYYGLIYGAPVNDFEWNDNPNDSAGFGLVEVIPEPTSLGFLGLGAIGALARRRR